MANTKNGGLVEIFPGLFHCQLQFFLTSASSLVGLARSGCPGVPDESESLISQARCLSCLYCLILSISLACCFSILSDLTQLLAILLFSLSKLVFTKLTCQYQSTICILMSSQPRQAIGKSKFGNLWSIPLQSFILAFLSCSKSFSSYSCLSLNLSLTYFLTASRCEVYAPAAWSFHFLNTIWSMQSINSLLVRISCSRAAFLNCRIFLDQATLVD